MDEQFWKRADAYIHVANEQSDLAKLGEVNASFTYACARFNAFTITSEAPNVQALKDAKARALDHFTAEFRRMLEDNLDDHIAHFDRYFTRKAGK
ncbi:MAG TPA: DUF3144 domain-containing protein [Usitatibacter sp.]|nr:DUF3144 domain-containing protein [Usitatibacter sp.]